MKHSEVTPTQPPYATRNMKTWGGRAPVHPRSRENRHAEIISTGRASRVHRLHIPAGKQLGRGNRGYQPVKRPLPVLPAGDAVNILSAGKTSL